ncbi:MAG: twin-arginine translocation signal domain-containing protein [Burkholderiales bacterium]|nr:twin-arginine translocation signal domain-containing protein [Burkholderiales bacterium]
MPTTIYPNSIAPTLVNGVSRRSFLKGLGAAAIMASLPTRDAQAMLPRVPGLLSGFKGPLVDRWVDDRCLEHVSINMKWARECTALPCFRGVAFPQYAEQIILAELSGPGTKYTGKKYPIIIHIWKGLCPNFMGNLSFPGGYGVEIGIYRWLSREQVAARYNERHLAKDTMWTPRSLNVAAQLPRPGAGLDERWYPAPELKAKIEFQLLDPENSDGVVIDSEERRKYIRNNSPHVTTRPYQDPSDFFWCTDWLTRESYERWAKSRDQYKGGPGFIDGVQLSVRWKIQGIAGDVIHGRWDYQPSDSVCAPLPFFGCLRNNPPFQNKRSKNTPANLDTPYWPEPKMEGLTPSFQRNNIKPYKPKPNKDLLCKKQKTC